jgi:hypothetical protein
MGRVTAAVAAIVGVVAIWLWVLPPVAHSFGWATRWPPRMPGTVHFLGRDYDGRSGCLPRNRNPLGHAPGVRVGSVPVVLGSSIPILARSGRHRGDPAEVAIVTEPHEGCYVTYALEGGP